MNKEGFNQLVSDYSKADQKFQDLEKLVDLYPYSQPLRMLSMKSSVKRSKVEYQNRLGIAAFYSTDRYVLRSLVEKGKVPGDLGGQPVAVGKAVKQISRAKPKAEKLKSSNRAMDMDQLRKEVLANLQALQKSKAHFLELTEEGEMEIKNPQTVKKSKPASKRNKKNTAPKVRAATNEKSIHKNLRAKPKTSRSRTKKDDIIDKFIAEKPSITPNQKAKENQSDLSKPSSVLKEDLVSENLAVIFANQGKTAKAIDIYKKLIWKFPQKKASFAARIEELKKK